MISTAFRTTAALILFLAGVLESAAAPLTRGGRAAAVLVVAESNQAREAAARIQAIVKEMSGATLGIVRESDGTPRGLVPIYVGHTRFAATKGIRSANLKAEEIVLIATDDFAIVLGNEGAAGPRRSDIQQGTMFAAVELLHRLGARWLWPDPTGHVIPKTRDVALANVEYRHAPKVFDRGMRLQVGMADFWPNVVAKFDRQPGQAPLHDWPLYARLGGSRSITARHSFGDWYDRFFTTHPEYFARGPDGGFSWLHIPERAKLCVSNPAVLEQVVADAKAFYDAADNPTAATYSLTPNDGQGFCLCPICRSMDPPSGRKESWNVYNNGTKRPELVTHVSLSDRYTTFWNKVAARLERETPGMLLGTLAYSVYRAPPIEVKRLHPNIAIGYVGGGYTNDNQRTALLREWAAWKGICDRMFWRPNFMKEGEGFPLVWATRMGADLKTLIASGLISVDMPNVHHHWGTQGLNYYMLARLMWDDSLEPAAVIDDYARTGFGAAAPIVRRYLARLEEVTDRFARHQAAHSQVSQTDDEDPDARRGAGAARRRTGPSPWDVVWTDAVMRELGGLLGQAAKAVRNGTPEAVRVGVFREGLEFARNELPVRRAIDTFTADGSKDNEFAVLMAVARVEQWLLAHRDSKAVGVVEGAPYWWRGKRDLQFFSRLTIAGRARRLGGNRYLVSVPAYSMRGRFTTIEFSADGRTWSAPQPYQVEHEYNVPAGTKAIWARLTFKGANGDKAQEPVKIDL